MAFQKSKECNISQLIRMCGLYKWNNLLGIPFFSIKTMAPHR